MYFQLYSRPPLIIPHRHRRPVAKFVLLENDDGIYHHYRGGHHYPRRPRRNLTTLGRTDPFSICLSPTFEYSPTTIFDDNRHLLDSVFTSLCADTNDMITSSTKNNDNKVLIKNDDDKITITIDVPGVKLQDLKVEMEGGHLIISGSHNRKNFHGEFSRRISLNNIGVDTTKLEANLSNGVLVVSGPKLLNKPDPVSIKILENKDEGTLTEANQNTSTRGNVAVSKVQETEEEKEPIHHPRPFNQSTTADDEKETRDCNENDTKEKDPKPTSKNNNV